MTILLWVLMVWCVGCKDNTSSNNPAVVNGTNTPVIANTSNAFAFTLTANAYTANTVYDVSFSSDSLACSLTIAHQTTGAGSLIILDSTNSLVYSDSTLSNKVVALTQSNKGIPKSIRMIFNGYTGTIYFALSKNGSTH
jgi:serine protease inhibitor